MNNFQQHHFLDIRGNAVKMAETAGISLTKSPYMCAVLSCFSRVWLFATLWTVAHQAPLSMGFSREEYWSGLPCPPPGDLLDLGIEPKSLLLHLQMGYLLLIPSGKPWKKKCHTAEEMGSIHGTSKAPTTKSRLKNQVQTGFEPMTFSLWDQCFTTWPQMRKYLKIREEYLLPF